MSEPTDPSVLTDATDPAHLAVDLAEVCALTASGIEMEHGLIQISTDTWALHGTTTYGGDVIVAEYHDLAEASEVLRLVEGDEPGPPFG